jgi:hypothetical protein
MNKVEKAVQIAIEIANNPLHGYTQSWRSRWGADYDCSSYVITAFDKAGIPVVKNGATYTGNMLSAFLKSGFTNVTRLVNRGTGSGLMRGDVLLREHGHTAIYIGNGRIVHALSNEVKGKFGGQVGDQTGREILEANYYNSPPQWTAVLRYKTATDENPYRRPVAFHVDNVTFRGEDARWVIWHLVRKGYPLIATSSVAGKNTWGAIHDVQEKVIGRTGSAWRKTYAALET